MYPENVKIHPSCSTLEFPEQLASRPWEVTTEYLYSMAKSDLIYFVYTLEAMDGACYIHTLDPKIGLVRVMVAWGWEEPFLAIIEALSRTIDLKLVSGPVYQF